MATSGTKRAVVGHSMTHSTVTDALRLINTMGSRAIQILLGDPGDKIVKSIDTIDAMTTVKIRQKHGFYVAVHGKFLYNFCRNSQSIEWQKIMLLKELTEANKINADVVIHQGKNIKDIGLTKTEALQQYANNVSDVLVRAKKLDLKNKILLENSARQGTECGYSLTDLHDIYNRLDPEVLEHVSFCIDLCHIFVAGELDMRKEDDVIAWFARFKSLFGLEKLALIHFNDSGTEFDGANDNHASVPYGYIGRENIKGFQAVCQLCFKEHIPMILETPDIFKSLNNSIEKNI